MLTAEIIRGKNRCKCAQCVRCYDVAIAAHLEEQRQLEELREEMNRAGLELVQAIAFDGWLTDATPTADSGDALPADQPPVQTS
jgi:hypothetical protein